MSNPILVAGLAILATALIALLFFGDGGSIAGMDPDSFAELAQLGALALVIGAALVATRHRVNMRLWHVAAWLAAFVALMAGYAWWPVG